MSRTLKHISGRSDLQRFGGKLRPVGEIRQINIQKTTPTRDNDCTQRKTIIGKMGSYSVKFEMNAASGNVTSKKVSVALTSSLIIVLVTLVDEKRYSILDLMWRDTTLVV